MWFDDDQNYQVIIFIDDEVFEVFEDDYFLVKFGIVYDQFEGENVFGGEVLVLCICAMQYELIDVVVMYLVILMVLLKI